MFDYIIFRTKRALLQFFCNFIPFQNLRIKARNAVYAKFLGTKVVSLNEVESHLPQKVLTQMNAYDNEYFMSQNAKIAQGGGIHIISLALTAAILNLIKIPKTPNPRSILGLLSAFATKPLP